MMRPEEIRERLKQVAEPEWVQVRSKQLAGRKLASPWLADDAEVDPAEDDGPRLSPTFRVSAMSDADRRAYFAVLFPKLAEDIERAWQAMGRRPYPTGRYGDYFSFRAPNNPVLVNLTRDEWIFDLTHELSGYDPDVTWLAAWGGHVGAFGSGIDAATDVLTAAIDAGGPVADEVLDILKQSAAGQHDVGMMGTHIVRAMLDSSRPDAWEYIAKLLLAAQRQEGLRQSILESVDRAHPEAYVRMLKLIDDENLVRFSSVVRAIDLWFEFLWDSMATKHAASIVERVIGILDDPAARAKALAGKDHETAYLAVWCEAFHDADKAKAVAIEMLRDKAPERRWIALHMLEKLGLPGTLGHFAKALADPDIRVAARALDGLGMSDMPQWNLDGTYNRDFSTGEERAAVAETIFDGLEALAKRVGLKGEKFKPLVFPWGRAQITGADVGDTLVANCPASRVDRLVGLMASLSPSARSEAAWVLAGARSDQRWTQRKLSIKPLSPAAHGAMVALLADSTATVRETAGTILATQPLTDAEAAAHEALFERGASDVRTRAVGRLLLLPDERVLEAAKRLLGSRKSLQAGGLALLRGLADAGRSVKRVQAAAVEWAASTKKVPKDLQSSLDAIATATTGPRVTQDDAFGLAKPVAPRPVPALRKAAPAKITPAAVACLWSLDDLVREHRATVIKPVHERGEDSAIQPVALGGIEYIWAFASNDSGTLEEARAACTILDIIEPWLRDRPASMRDADGLELVRAWLLYEIVDDDTGWNETPKWPRVVTAARGEGGGASGKARRTTGPEFLRGIELLLHWGLRLTAPDAIGFVLDQAHGAAARGDIFRVPKKSGGVVDGELRLSMAKWLERLTSCRANVDRLGTLELARELDGLYRAALPIAQEAFAKAQAAPKKRYDDDDDDDDDDDGNDRSDPPEGRLRLNYDDFVRLWQAGDIGDDELVFRLVRLGSPGQYDNGRASEFGSLMELRKPRGKRRFRKKVELTPRLDAILEKIRVRVLEIELGRGDARTPATPHVMAMDPSGGIDAAVGALAAMGKLKLVRGYIWNSDSKAASMSGIIRSSRPGEKDTPEAFAAAAKKAGLTDTQLVELALYQPRWAQHVEHALGWTGLDEGVLWLRSHTKEAKNTYSDPDEVKEPWEARAAELTPITSDSLADGAVDRAWFERCYKRLGPKRWQELYDACKYASGGNGHTRARLFADAILGDVKEKTSPTVSRRSVSRTACAPLACSPSRRGMRGASRFLPATRSCRSSVARAASTADPCSRPARSGPWRSDSRTSRGRPDTRTRCACSGRWRSTSSATLPRGRLS